MGGMQPAYHGVQVLAHGSIEDAGFFWSDISLASDAGTGETCAALHTPQGVSLSRKPCYINNPREFERTYQHSATPAPSRQVRYRDYGCVRTVLSPRRAVARVIAYPMFSLFVFNIFHLPLASPGSIVCKACAPPCHPHLLHHPLAICPRRRYFVLHPFYTHPSLHFSTNPFGNLMGSPLGLF